MFDGLLKSKFYSKCKSDMKLTRARIEVIQRKRNAIQKYLRNDVTDLLRNGLGMNAYSRVEGLLIEINTSNCYELIDKCCMLISNHLTSMNKQRDCPEECRESVSSLMFAAARIADLPELRELREVFSEKYGNSLDCFANKELVVKLRCEVPSRDEKLQLLQEIAAESGLVWSPKALDIKLFKEADNKDLYKETNGGDFMIKNEFLGPENVKLDGRSLHKKENAPVIKPIEGHDRSSVAARNHQERVEKHRGEPKASDMKLFKEQADNKWTHNMFPRWKGKAAKAKALANPMSTTVSSLGSSLIESNTKGLLSGSSILLEVTPQQSELLNKACFGRPVVTSTADNHRFQLSLEEAFYMFYVMKCLVIVDEEDRVQNEGDLWDYMTSKNPNFPLLFKGYSHLRSKNWVVRKGSQFGVDFVAYSHHPSFVHSEYAVLVLRGDDDDDANGRLRVWSDFHCTLRLCGSVAKTLLVLYVRGSKGAVGNKISVSSFDDFTVEERVVTRWNPKQCREDQSDSSGKCH